MDVQRLIGEVARRHNVLVDPSDPIFVTVVLNELLLAEHLEKVQAAVAQAEHAAAKASQLQVESAKRAATQLVSDGARQVAEQVRIAGSALRLQLEHLLRDSVASAQAAAAEAARYRRSSRRAAAVAVACACLVVGIVGGLWLRSS